MNFDSFFKKTYASVRADSISIGKPFGKAKLGDVRIPLRMFTRHGLISGSTGTGKSRAAQVLAERLSLMGVPVLFTDVKGDVSNFTIPGEEEKVRERCEKLLLIYSPTSFPTLYWSLSQRLTPIRFRLDEIPAVLLSKLLELNRTQESHLIVALKRAKDEGIPLISLDDLSSYLISLRNENVPGLSKSSMDVILRKIEEMKALGAGSFFSSPSLSPKDLLGVVEEKGVINVLNLSDFREKPILFSTAMAFLLHKIFREFPELGDVERPKLVLFFDEAHYLFKGANKSFISLMGTILRQIRSKGVGVFFITQEPGDISEEVLAQLGTKILFSLRAFTKRDIEKARALSKSLPPSPFYDTFKELKSMPIGVSLVSTLNEVGELLPPIKVMWRPPLSSMEVCSMKRMKDISHSSPLFKKYGEIPCKGRPGRRRDVPFRTISKCIGFIARRAFGFLGWTINKMAKGIVNFLGWLLYRIVIRPLKGLFHTLTFGIFRKRRRRKRG